MSVLTGTGVDPQLAAAEDRLAALAAAQGLGYVVNPEERGGFIRSQADTARYMQYRDVEYALWAKRNPNTARRVSKYQWRPIAAFGGSYHNFGAAFDVTMTAGTFAALGALAPAAGLRWGGSAPFVRIGRTDPPHFELPISLLEARARWLARGNAPGMARLTTAAQALALTTVIVLGGLAALYGRGWKL